MAVDGLANLPLVAVKTASAALAIGKHTPVDATGGPVTVTLPAPTRIGQRIRVEKVDASTNVVTVSGTIRGVAASVAMPWLNESIEFFAETIAPGTPSWRVSGSHKTKTALDAAYGPGGTAGNISAAAITADVRAMVAEYAGRAARASRLEATSSPRTVMRKKPAVLRGGSGDLGPYTLGRLMRQLTVTIVNGSASVVATAGVFSAADVGKKYASTAGGLAAAGTITAVADATHATLSNNATVSGTASIVVDDESGLFLKRDTSLPLTLSGAAGISGTAGQVRNSTVRDVGAFTLEREYRGYSRVGIYGFSHITTYNALMVYVDTGFGFEAAMSEPEPFTATASPTFIVLDFGAAVPWMRVRYEFTSQGNNSGVLGDLVLTAETTAGATAVAPAAPTTPGVLVVAADSYAEGGLGGPTATRVPAQSFAATLGKMLGFPQKYNRGQSGTGWLNPGAGVSSLNRTLRDRLPEIVTLKPDTLVIALGENDSSYTAAQVQAEVEYCLDYVATNLPRTPVYVIGPWGSTTVGGLPTVRDGVKAGCLTRGVPFADPLTGNDYDGAGNLLYAYGKAWLNTADFTDGIHVTPAASRRLGERVGEFVIMNTSPLRTYLAA